MPALELIFELLLGVGIHPSELHEHPQELQIPEEAPIPAVVEPIKLEASVLNPLEQVRDCDVLDQEWYGELEPNSLRDRGRCH